MDVICNSLNLMFGKYRSVKSMNTVSLLVVIFAFSVFVYTEGPRGQQKHSWFSGLKHNCSWKW